MTYVLEHTRFGFCWWDLAAAIILIAVIAMMIVVLNKQKRTKKELEEELSGVYAAKAAGNLAEEAVEGAVKG